MRRLGAYKQVSPYTIEEVRPIAAEADFSSDLGATSRSLRSSKLTPEEQRQRRQRLALNAATAYLSYDRSVSPQRRFQQIAGQLSINPSDIQALVVEGIERMLAGKIPGYRPEPALEPLPSTQLRKRRPASPTFAIRRQLVLEYLKKYGSGSGAEISTSLRLNPQTINLLLRQMRASGDVIFERDRGSRAYIWFLKQ